MGISSRSPGASAASEPLDVEIARMLEAIQLGQRKTEDARDDLVAALRRGLKIHEFDTKDELNQLAEKFAETMLNGVSRGKISAPASPSKSTEYLQPGLEAATFSQESSSPETLSPKVTTRNSVRGASRSPKPNPNADNRGRSPARTRYPNIPRPDRSRTPVGRDIPTRGRSPGPYGDGSAARSKSPIHRNMPRSPFQRGRSPSPAGRTIPPAASPSIFYDAEMFEANAMNDTPSSQRPPKPSDTPQSSRKRPPLTSVNFETNSSKNASLANQSATMPSFGAQAVEDAETAKAREIFKNLRVDEIQFNIGVGKPKVSSPYGNGQSPSHRRSRRSMPKSSTRSGAPTVKPILSPGSQLGSSFDSAASTHSFPTPGPDGEEEANTRGQHAEQQDSRTPAPQGPVPTRSRSRSPFKIFSRLGPQSGVSPGEIPGAINVDFSSTFTSPMPHVQPQAPAFPSTRTNHQASAPNPGTSSGHGPAAPSNVEFHAVAASGTPGIVPVTPHDFNASSTKGMDTNDTAVNKKGRNTATPFINNDQTLPQFTVNLSSSPKNEKNTKVKGRTKRGGLVGGLRRGLSGRRPSQNSYQPIPASNSASPSTEAADGQSTPSSTGSSMDIDGHTPQPQNTQTQQQSAPTVAPSSGIQFSIGVGDQKSPTGKLRGKRRNQRTFRSQPGRTQSVSYLPSQAATADDSAGQYEPPYAEAHYCARSQSVPEADEYMRRETEISMKRAIVLSLREEGKSHYIAKDYRSSILTYTSAIKHYISGCLEDTSRDLLAVLLSNRAAGLLMIGACEAAANDCEKALQYVSDATVSTLSAEGGAVLRPKLYNRMGRALIKLGKVDSAENSFTRAIESAHVNLEVLKASNPSSVHWEEGLKGLEQIIQESILGQTEACSLRELMHKLLICTQSAAETSSQSRTKEITLEALEYVKSALMTATGCDSLHEQKVSLLASLKRWREVGSHSERLATANAKLDGCFTEDLAALHPFPGVSPTKNLDPDFFKDANEDDIHGAELKLNTRAAAEAVLRIPFSLVPYYIRSLRLEERYPAAEGSIRAVESYIRDRSGSVGKEGLREAFTWLPKERERLMCTRIEREKADELFRGGDFAQAAAKYAMCLRIDSDGATDGSDAGGRLHAVLHCNRAACLMATKRFEEALTECTAALRIHPRYMKAMLRRARCYSRLDRLEESASEFQRWVDIVKQAKTSPQSMPISSSPCIFDGPHEVSDDDIAQVKGELNDVIKTKAKADAAARAEAHYRQQRQRWEQERASSQAGSDARSRRDYFYSQQSSGSRRWDSFADRGPKRSSKSNHHDVPPQAEERSSRSIVNEKNHYKALGIKNDASDSEIKKAYRKLALKYHPDKVKNDDAGADEIFRRVKEAYEVLIDSSSRRKYDQEIRWRMRF